MRKPANLQTKPQGLHMRNGRGPNYPRGGRGWEGPVKITMHPPQGLRRQAGSERNRAIRHAAGSGAASGYRVFHWDKWEHWDTRMDTGFACSHSVPSLSKSGNNSFRASAQACSPCPVLVPGALMPRLCSAGVAPYAAALRGPACRCRWAYTRKTSVHRARFSLF